MFTDEGQGGGGTLMILPFLCHFDWKLDKEDLGVYTVFFLPYTFFGHFPINNSCKEKVRYNMHVQYLREYGQYIYANIFILYICKSIIYIRIFLTFSARVNESAGFSAPPSYYYINLHFFKCKFCRFLKLLLFRRFL